MPFCPPTNAQRPPATSAAPPNPRVQPAQPATHVICPHCTVAIPLNPPRPTVTRRNRLQEHPYRRPLNSQPCPFPQLIPQQIPQPFPHPPIPQQPIMIANQYTQFQPQPFYLPPVYQNPGPIYLNPYFTMGAPLVATPVPAAPPLPANRRPEAPQPAAAATRAAQDQPIDLTQQLPAQQLQNLIGNVLQSPPSNPINLSEACSRPLVSPQPAHPQSQ